MDILDFLCCPACLGDGKFSYKADARRKSVPLVCTTCGTKYELRDNVPVFASEFDAGFDKRWEKHPKPQATTEEIFWQKTGFDPRELEGKTVIDGGCGIGRFSAVAARCGATVIGVDASTHALAGARENVPGGLFVQGNLLKLPIKTESIDMGFSLGVVHHTANPVFAFSEIARTIKPGGKLALWVYFCPVTDRKYLPHLDMVHEITRACPPEVLHNIFERYAVKIRDINQGAWGPLEQIFRVSVSPDNEECISDTFDWHTPQYRYWHTDEEIKDWFVSNGFENIQKLPFPTSAVGTKMK